MLSFDELQKKYKDQKPQTVAGPSTEDPLYIKYREAVEAEKPKVAGGTVNPIISFGNVRENPVLKRKTNTTKTYSQALEESRNRAKTLEMGAKLPTVIPPKGDVSKLILPDTGGGGTVNPTLKRNEVRTNYDYMTDREAAVYKYYRDRGQVEKAQEYLDALEMDVNQRAAMQKQEDAKKLAEESWPVALYARAVGNIGQAAGAVYAATMEGADKPVDPYHPLMGGVNMNEGLYEGLMGESTGANKVVKDIGLGIFDWATQAAVLGPATPYVMAAGAAAGNTKDALERGGTTDEAVMYGLAGGAAEAITEKLGYDRLFKYGANAIAKKLGYAGLFELSEKIADKGALAKFLWEVMPHGVSEGLEEATSEFTNIVADTLVLGDNSQMKQIAQTAMENGATESEAVKTALQQGFLQVIYSGAIGAASGGVIAGGIGGLSRAKGRNALEMAGNPVETAREAMTNAGKEVTKRINDMRSQGKAEVPEGTTQGNVLPEQGNVMGNSENTSMEQRQENKALRDFGEKYYYTEGQKVVNEEAERRGDTSFIPAFQTYYTAGLTGVKESDIKQTAETAVADKLLLNRAYEAGALDRKEDLEMRLKGTGKMTDTPGVVLETEAITEGQKALANLVSETTGAEVWVVDRIKEGVRGTFDRNKGRITIALDSGQFAGTLFHESIHFIRDASPEGFDRMRQAVFSAAAAMKGVDLETYTKKYEKMYVEAYQKEGREIDFDQILEEMVADAFAEVAGNEKAMRTFVTELKKENPSVLEKLKEFVDSLLKTLKSLVTDGRFSSFGAELQEDIDFTERMAKMLAEEMKKAGEMQRGEKTNRENGKQVFSDINLEADPKVPGTEVRLSYKNKNDLPLMENITQSKKEDNGKERGSENRFSLKEPIEETKDLIAVHNLTGEKLRKLLDLQGIPMPSIAITKSDATAEDFGEISLVFRKDTIDPADERNKVFDADAWTPMFPMLDKEEYGKTRVFLEELVRTMQAQTKSGKNAQGFMGENTMRAAMANRFVSLGEIKEAREKLEHLPKEEFEALREEMNQRLFGVLEEIYDTGSQTGINEVYEMEDIGEQIQNMAEEAKGVPSARQIQQNLRKAGYPISMELAEQTARVLEEIKEMPTDFFEAKPERVVEFAEVAAAVVPDDLEVDLRKAVENKIPQVLEYEAGSKESRVRQLNRVEGVRFSIREEDVSYNRLIQKPDMKITFLDSTSMDGKERKDAVEKAKKSVRDKKHPRNTDEIQYIYCKDIEKDIQVGKKGIAHALRRKWVESGIAMTKLGDLLENAILVNELEPREGVKRAYVLLGYGEDENGAGYPTYFVVNEYPTGNVTVEDLAVLYSSKTQKMEPYANNASMIAGKNPLLTPGSTISIEELLDKVNAIYSDILSQDVADHFSNTRRQTSLSGNVRFSIRDEEYDALVEENEALQEANEALRRQFEITKDAVHDPVSAKKAVRKWLKAHDSEYDVDDFTEKFVALADYVANAGDRVDFQKVMGALQKLAYDALSESKVLNTDLSDAYKDFKNEVRKTKIKVTDSMLEELEYYGGYIEFRKRNFGKLNLSRQSGIPADVFYQEMAEKYPGLLKEGNVKTQVDILIDLANTVDSLQPIYENPYGMNLDEYAMDAAYDLWEMYFDIEMQKPTFADKYEKKVEQLQIENQKLKAAKNKMRQEMKERHEEQMEKAKAEANKKLEEEREKYIRQVDVLLEEKYKLRQKLETQWKAHKNSMVEAQRTELARLIAEGKKTAAEIRELKKDKKELKQRMDEVLEKEDLWVQACQAILRENNKEINRYKKQVQRLKESKEKQRERAIRKYDRLLEAKFQLQDRQKKQSERRKYAKYRRVVEQETNKMLKWITKPTDTYHVPEEMTKGLKELLTKIGTSDGEIMIMQNDLFQAIKDLERFRPKDGKEEADFFVEHDELIIDSMNEFIRKYPNGFDLENLPADEMKELADILRSIHKRITNANKFISLFRQVEVREVSEKFLSESQKMKNTVQEGRTRQVLDFFNMDLVDPYSFFSGMGDSVRNTLFKATEEGFERKIRHEAEAEKFISGIVSKKEAAAWSTAAPTLYKIGGRDLYMTPAEVMSLYATYRRNQGILHLLEGGFKTAFNKLKRMKKEEAETRLKNFKPYQPSRKELEDVFKTLTDKQKEVVEKAQDFLSNVVGGWGNETSMEMFGYKKFNDQRYFPISSDEDYINNVFGDPNQKQKALVNIAAAKPTSDQAKNPIVIEDFFTVFARHIDQMSSYNAFVPVISDWNKFMGYKKYSREAGVQEVESVKKEISRTMGKGAISYIRKFLEDIQSVNTGEKAPITKTLVSNMKRASVGANLRVAIQQPVSIVRAADMISPKYLMMAFAKGKNDFEKIYEYAPIAQWKEWGHYDMNIARGLEERIRGQSILGKLSDYSMVMASWGDKFTWGRIWKAVEMETRDKYPDLKGERFDRKVGERFSEIINRTQVVDSMLHRSQIMREKTIYKQMTTSFMGEPIKTYNMMRNSIVALMKDNTKENRNKVVRSFVTLTFNAVAVAAAAAVVDALRDDDDDETWAEKWLEAFRGDYEKAESGGEKVMAFLSSNVGQNTNPFTYIPYLKDVVSLLQGFTVQRTDIGWVNDIIKSGNVLMQYIQGESPYTFTAVLANTAASLSKATGLPIASAKRDMEAIKNTVINQAMGLETQYGNKKLTYALGSEKNVSMYVKMMIDAKLSGNDKLATRIYNEMVNAGISNEKMESQLGNKEKEKIKKDSAAMEAVEAYAKKDYDTYTQKLDELRKKYSQKNIESTIRSMYEDKYGEEDIETFDIITQDFWEKEEEVESSQFKTVIDAMMEAKLSGKLGEATKLYNYMVNNGLPNDKLDSAIDSREKELLKNDPLTKEGAEAFHEGDADRYVDIVEQLKNKNYYARNVTSAIESMHDKLYGEDDEDTFETITQDFWEEDEADEMVSYELLFNAFWNGSRGTYNEVWGLLNAAGKEDKSIRASMRNRCYDAYWKAEGEGNTEEMNKAAAEYQRNGGKLETLLKPPKE